MQRVFLFFLLLCSAPCTAIQIVEFCPDPYQANDPDEYIVLGGEGSLDGILVTDDEGGFRFPEGSVMNGRITIAKNGEAFLKTFGQVPDYEWFDHSPEIPDVVRSGNLQLANTNDQLKLYEGGVLVQEIEWPDDVAARQGQIHYLESGVWDPRPLMIGQSRFTSTIFTGISGISFVSPDCSIETYTNFVGSAEKEIQVNVYEFSSRTMAETLIDSKKRGVDVKVLLEGGPVGGVTPEEKGIIALLRESGIPVYFMMGTEAAHAPYRYDHAKYIIVDQEAILVTSENFKPSGFPASGGKGNRGWAVILEDPAVAAYFSVVFSHDLTGAWTIPAKGEGNIEPDPRLPDYTQEFTAFRFTNATVIPVIAPDTAYLIRDMLEDAQSTIDIEQAYITNQSDGSFNPFLEAAMDAARRGVQVRVLLDSSYFSVEGEEDNDEMVATLNQIAREQNLPVSARCADLDGNNLKEVHNKGAIVDGKTVLISSINWNSNSPQFNREAGVIIVDPGIGAYFTGVFEDDWECSDPNQGQGGPDMVKIGIAAVCVTLLCMAFIVRRLRRF